MKFLVCVVLAVLVIYPTTILASSYLNNNDAEINQYSLGGHAFEMYNDNVSNTVTYLYTYLMFIVIIAAVTIIYFIYQKGKKQQLSQFIR